MLGGAGEVIAARSAIIGEAVRSPSTADQGKIGRVLPGKIDALLSATSAAAAVMWDHQ